jgi:hypothetical protein
MTTAHRREHRMAKRAKVKRISHGEWDRFEKSLVRAPKARRLPAGKSRGAVESVPQSEPETDDVLLRFAERSHWNVRRGSPPKGNIVFLHGITGADLAGVGEQRKTQERLGLHPANGLRRNPQAENGRGWEKRSSTRN